MVSCKPLLLTPSIALVTKFKKLFTRSMDSNASILFFTVPTWVSTFVHGQRSDHNSINVHFCPTTLTFCRHPTKGVGCSKLLLTLFVFFSNESNSFLKIICGSKSVYHILLIYDPTQIHTYICLIVTALVVRL